MRQNLERATLSQLLARRDDLAIRISLIEDPDMATEGEVAEARLELIALEELIVERRRAAKKYE